MNNTVDLLIPLQNKIEKFLFARSAVRQRGDNGKLEPVARLSLLQHTDLVQAVQNLQQVPRWKEALGYSL